ncbi:MAG: peptidylprolyl isomerase [Vicingaceae bacterium]
MKTVLLSVTFVAGLSLATAQTPVTFYTSQGDFVVEIYDNVVPITGGNFLSLVNQKFYDGVIFHRVIDNFMIQGGDPTGTGSGGPGYTIQDEFDPTMSNVQKTISMANSGPNTGGSQFFINLVNNTYLDYDKPPTTSKHPVFGMTIVNFNVVQAIGKVSTDGNDRPITPVFMDSVREGNFQTLGLQEANVLSSFRLFPNPVNVASSVEIVAKRDKATQAVLRDLLGKTISDRSLNLRAGFNQFKLNEVIGELPVKGIYHLSIVTDEGSKTLKILVP